jgi:hypothetical protein
MTEEAFGVNGPAGLRFFLERDVEWVLQESGQDVCV